MHLIIAGIGRSGRALARLLSEAGLDLILIVEDPAEAAGLADLDCPIVEGLSIDRDVLEEARVQDAAAVLAISANENLNIMCCQIAKVIYNVPHVIARSYNPSNAHFYDLLGIKTVCSTQLTVEAFLKNLGFIDAGEESSRLAEILSEAVPDMAAEMEESAC